MRIMFLNFFSSPFNRYRNSGSARITCGRERYMLPRQIPTIHTLFFVSDSWSARVRKNVEVSWPRSQTEPVADMNHMMLPIPINNDDQTANFKSFFIFMLIRKVSVTIPAPNK